MLMTKRPDAPLDIIVSGSVLSLASFYNQSETIDTQARLLSEFLYAEPMLRLIGNYHRYLKLTRYYVRFIDDDVNDLSIRTRNNYFFSVQAIRRYVNRRRKLKEPSSSWHRRRSRSVSGTTQYKNGVVHTLDTLIGGYVSPTPSSARSAQVDLTRYSDSGIYREHFSFDDARNFALNVLVPAVNGLFKRTTTFSRYGYHTLSSVEVSRDSIRMSLSDIVWQSYPSSRSMKRPSIDIDIRRGSTDSAFGMTIYITGFSRIVLDNNPLLGYPKWVRSAYSQNIISMASQYDTDVLIGGVDYAEARSLHSFNRPIQHRGIIESMNMPISMFKIGLYHTQSKAFHDAQLQLGKNLQNILQAPAFIEMIADVFLGDYGDLFHELFNPARSHDFLDQLRKWVVWISGNVLMVDFAVKPTYRAFTDLMAGFVGPLSAEGEFSIKGTDLSAETLTYRNVFADFLKALNLTESDVSSYTTTMRSTVYTSTEYQHLAYLVWSSVPLASIGGVPTPTDVWKYASGSFAVDWALNVGPLIDDHQQYMQSMTMPFRIGHSVKHLVRLKDSRTFDLFMRSTEMSLPIDPPGDTWLPVSTFHADSVPLGVQKLLRAPFSLKRPV